jgi:predicted PurR-regulated permease PerM
MWFNNVFFKYATGTILSLIVIILLGQIGFFFEPFKILASVFFPPLLISLVLYYLIRPLLNRLKKLKLPTTLAVIIIYILLLLLMILFTAYSGTLIINELSQLFLDLPKIAQNAVNSTTQFLNSKNVSLSLLNQFQEQVSIGIKKIIPFISVGFLNTLSIITNATSAIVLVPFILFYLLCEDRAFVDTILKYVPPKFRNEIIHILKESDKTLSAYITGQAIIACILALMMYFGYLIIGIKYAFLLAVFVMITSFVPMFGAVIGVVPAFFVALTINPMAGLKIIILTIIVQQIEGNFISPNLVGKRLSIHPLTIILLFVGFAALFGFIGMLISIPAYAVIKVLFNGTKKIYLLMK